MDIDWILDFLAVARLGNFSKAAEAREVAQSTLSRRVQALEEWAGSPLLDRARHPVQLSPAGQAFHAGAQLAVQQLADARKAVQTLKGDSRRSITFLMPHAVSAGLFMKWLPTLQQSVGGFVPRVIQSNAEDVARRFDAGEADFALAYSHPAVALPRARRSGQPIKVGSESYVPVCSASCKGTGGIRPPPEHCQPLLYLAYVPALYIGRVIDAALNARLRPAQYRRVAEDGLVFSMREAVIRGSGVAWLPASLIAEDLRENRLAPVGDGGWPLRFDVLLERRQAASSSLAGRVWDAWQALAATPAQRPGRIRHAPGG